MYIDQNICTMSNLNSVVSRVHFCPRCYDKPPQKGTKFLLYHSSQNSFLSHRLKSVPVSGFTPHAFEYMGLSEKGLPIACVACLIDGCGMEMEWNQQSQIWNIRWLHRSYIEMSFSDYNAMQKFTNTGYEIKELCQ